MKLLITIVTALAINLNIQAGSYDGQETAIEQCSYTCSIIKKKRNRTDVQLDVQRVHPDGVSDAKRGYCKGQVLIYSIGPDAQIFANVIQTKDYLHINRKERLNNGTIRYVSRIKEVAEYTLPFATNSCRVEFSAKD